MQALQPVQTFRSTDIPHCCARRERRMAVKRRQLLRQFVVPRDLLHEFVVFAIMLDRRFAHEAAAFDAPVILRDRKRVRSRRLS